MTDTALPLAMAALTLAGILAGYRVAMVLAGSAALFILVSDLPTAETRTNLICLRGRTRSPASQWLAETLRTMVGEMASA